VSHPGPAAVGLDVLRRGAVAFAVGLGAGLLLGSLQLAAGGADSLAEAFMGGALAFLLFHHVGVHAVAGGATAAGAQVGVALMLGTALAGWLLFRAGRKAADRAGGGTLRAALVGASVAVPYVSLSVGLAFLARADLRAVFPGAGGGSATELRPEPLSALLWTVLVAVVAGGAGGLEAAPERPPGPAGRHLRAAAAGGRRMALTALALSFVALMVFVALRPEATRAYFHRAFSPGPAAGALTVASTAAVAPNVATGVLAVAVGGSVEVEIAGESCTALSYGRFPESIGPGGLAGACSGDVGTAPPAYFLLLLVPLAASILGGHRGALRAGAGTPRQAVAVGVWSGLAGAAAITALMVLATVSVEAAGTAPDFIERSASVGPEVLVAGGVAALWGAAGGAGGGYLASRRQVGPGEPGPTDGSSRPDA
jgi:hypothetical protein